MITIMITGFACLAFGLYAGKKRAAGRSWGGILSDLTRAIRFAIVNAWKKASYPFKKENTSEHDECCADQPLL